MGGRTNCSHCDHMKGGWYIHKNWSKHNPKYMANFDVTNELRFFVFQSSCSGSMLLLFFSPRLHFEGWLYCGILSVGGAL